MNLSFNRLAQTLTLGTVLTGCGDNAFYNPDPNGNSNSVLDAGENDAGRFMPPPDASQVQVETCLGSYDLLRRSVQFTYRLTRGGNTLGSPFAMSSLTEATPGDAGARYSFETRAQYAGIPTGAVPPPPVMGTLGDSIRALAALSRVQATITGFVVPQAEGGCLTSMAWVFPAEGVPFVRGASNGDAGVVSYTTNDPASVTRVRLTAIADAGAVPVNFTFTAPAMTGDAVTVRDVSVCGAAGVPSCANSGDRVVVDIRFGARVPYDGGVSDAGSSDGATDASVDAAVDVPTSG